MLQIVIYKKTQFLGRIYTPDLDIRHKHYDYHPQYYDIDYQHWIPKPISLFCSPQKPVFVFDENIVFSVVHHHRLHENLIGRMKITTKTFLCQKLPIIGIFYFKITTPSSPCQKLPT